MLVEGWSLRPARTAPDYENAWRASTCSMNTQQGWRKQSGDLPNWDSRHRRASPSSHRHRDRLGDWDFQSGRPKALTPLDDPIAIERTRVLLHLYDQVSYVGFFELDDAKLLQACFRPLRLLNDLGRSREMVSAYANYASLMGILKKKKTAERFLDMAMSVAKEIGDPVALARAHLQSMATALFYGDHHLVEKRSKVFFEKHLQWLDDQDQVNGHIMPYFAKFSGSF